MDRSTIVRTGIAGAVAGLGLTVGGVAMANADTAAQTTDGTAATAQHRPGPPDGGRLAETLAEELGVSESAVRSALDAVREDRPAERPTEAERAARKAAFVKALAAELDLSAEKVEAALDAVRSEARSAARTHLKTRLDAAVESGTLTSADRASVLKAFDAEVIGGPGRPGGR